MAQLPPSSSFFRKISSGSLLVAGTAIGAGMLGIPMVTADAGFIPATMITLLVWIFMLATGLLLLEVTLKMPSHSNILSITQKYLGKSGKFFAGGMFVFLYYCLIVAYIAGGSPIVEALLHQLGLAIFNQHLSYILFVLVVAIIVFKGVRWIDRLNIVLSLCMFVAFTLMLLLGFDAVSEKRLLSIVHFDQMFFAVPILFGAFGYHNVIPSLCDYLSRDKKALRFSLIFGTLLALGIYLIWQFLVMGAVDQTALEKAMIEGKTAVAALQEASDTPALFFYGQWFGALALFTSLLGVSLSMCDFFADGLKRKATEDQIHALKANASFRFWLCLLTFLPPLLFALFHRDVFTQALGVAGGIGESILNGLLPVSLAWVTYKLALRQGKWQKTCFAFLFLLGLAVVGLEIYELYHS